MKFYNRKEEMKELNVHFSISKKHSSMIVITGRRRIGKTELIRQFFKKRKGMYFFVDSKKSESELLKEFTNLLRTEHKLPAYFEIKKWEDFLEFLFDASKNRQTTIAIDEFQRFLDKCPSFIYQLQKYWDLKKDDSKLFLLLSGSSMGMIRKIFIESNAPLFKRAHNIMRLKPFSFRFVKKMLSDMGVKNIKEQIEFYLIFGGVPKYFNLLQDYALKELEKSIIFFFLRKNSTLENEIEEIMIEEFGKENSTYYSILAAIAFGKETLSEIAKYTNMNETSLLPYIYNLSDVLEIIKRHIPIIEEDPTKSKKGRYILSDGLFKFWFRFIFKNMSQYEIGNYDYILKKIKAELNPFVGEGFENFCREFLLELLKKKKLHFAFDKIGSWWDRKGNEIDIVALNKKTKEVLFGECKWQNRKAGFKEFGRLKEKTEKMNWFSSSRKEYFALFSKSGFEQRFIKYAKEKKIMLFTLKDFEAAFSG